LDGVQAREPKQTYLLNYKSKVIQ